MVTYVTLYRWTEQGAKNVTDTVQRVEQAIPVVEQAGGRVLATYWLQGQYDFMTIAEWPDEEKATAFFLNLAKLGNVRSETLRAFDKETMQRILQNVR
ncbi:MAG TPA: GYD domain-containing protein [Chloroflexota bacterium]